MNTAKVKKMSLENFSIYGSFKNMTSPSGPKLEMADGKAGFYRDMLLLNLGKETTVAFSVTQVLNRQNIIDTVEMHSSTCEFILPMDGDVLLPVGIATPNGEVPLSEIEVFLVPKGTGVTLNKGVWHDAPFVVSDSCVNVLIALPERIYADDCFVYKIPDEHKLEII